MRAGTCADGRPPGLRGGALPGGGDVPAVAHVPRAQTRRDRSPDGRGTAPLEGRPGRPGLPGNGQNPRRRPRRGTGDDRRRRLRRGALPAVVRSHHAERASRPPHVRAVASPGTGRRHQRLQFPRGGLVLERYDRGGLRRRRGLEALFGNPAHRYRRAKDLQPSPGAERLAGRLQSGDRPGRRRG